MGEGEEQMDRKRKKEKCLIFRSTIMMILAAL